MECVFPVSGRLPRRGRDESQPPARKQFELLGRLRRLEAMVGDLGSQVEHVMTENDGSAGGNLTHGGDFQHHISQTDCSKAGGTSQASGDSGELAVAENGDLIVEQIFEAVQGPIPTHPHGQSTSSSEKNHHNGFYNFLLRHTSAGPPQEGAVGPPPSEVLFLWQVYLDNVDPFMKVLHVPTISAIMRQLRRNYESLQPRMQALVLAIALAGVMSLSEEEVHMNCHTTKAQVSARYRLRTEQALEQADFLNNPDITTLQALTIYLGVLQHTGETKSAWLLAGTLVRAAVSMKLHRDGSHSVALIPFETEMRRRLWWQICFIDWRSGDVEVSDYKISTTMFDTEMPVNANDAHLDPDMTRQPVIADGWTDTTVVQIRCEIWMLSRRLQSAMATLSEIETRLPQFQQSRASIEDKYLKHLDPNQPLHSFVATNARLFLTKVDLVLHQKQNSIMSAKQQPVDQSQSEKVFMSSLLIVEYTYALQNESRWQGWSWQIQGREPPWHALRLVLGHVDRCQWGPISSRAWSSTERCLDSLHEAARKDPRYQQLLVLVTAVKKRAEVFHRKTTEMTQANRLTDTTMTLSAPLARIELDEMLSTWNSQEPSSGEGADLDAHIFNDEPSLEMDWQVWDEMSGGLESSLDFWDMGSL